jgi:hypothetical protein
LTANITPENIDRVLAFLPEIEDKGEALFRVDQSVSMLDPYLYDAVVDRLVDALYAGGFVEPFDWPGWQDRAKEYVDHPDLLASADLEILQKLLTTHVRKERFCSGHLAAMIRCGHLTAVLKRLAEIRQKMD